MLPQVGGQGGLSHKGWTQSPSQDRGPGKKRTQANHRGGGDQLRAGEVSGAPVWKEIGIGSEVYCFQVFGG